MNVELLRKIQAHILEEPKRLIMSEGLRFGDAGASVATVDEPFTPEYPACGTVGCIAGWACVLSDPSFKDQHWAEIYTKARTALDINGYECTILFRVGEWPEELQDKHCAVTSAAELAALVNRRIDLFVDTNGQK